MSDDISANFSHFLEPSPVGPGESALPAALLFSHPTEQADEQAPTPAAPPARIFSHPGAEATGNDRASAMDGVRRADRGRGGGRTGRADGAAQGAGGRRRNTNGRSRSGEADA
ncbi:hypothetical protein [Actinoplanes regularis]|uniref:hypothetical protein n=1 Tax=Actinoplanes regularis TaxID=52697 RepID=UPI0024A3619C|nr:hypothetical protein [Actinoplanes regularis]GLW32593.1 hypothetical protein Areg01_55310 [Actinoplanes regularis]